MTTETTPHRDPIYAECERLRDENERLVEALVFSRPAPPPRKRHIQTADERFATVLIGWGGVILGATVACDILQSPLGLPIGGPLGGAFGVAAVLFTQWALRISP